MISSPILDDNARVKLMIENDDQYSDYINASYIDVGYKTNIWWLENIWQGFWCITIIVIIVYQLENQLVNHLCYNKTSNILKYNLTYEVYYHSDNVLINVEIKMVKN